MDAIVMLSDVERSRGLSDREAKHNLLLEAIDEVNDRFEQSLIAPVEVQKGIDEFGAVLQPDAPVLELLTELWLRLHPLRIRFALARGRLDVVPETPTPSVRHFDGPAFHEADEDLTRLESERRLISLRLSPDEAAVEQMSLVASLTYSHMLLWTRRQADIFRTWRTGGSQVEVADQLGVTQPTISEALSKVDARLVQEALAFLATKVEAAGERTP